MTRVVVGLSGGVDSSVAAALLLDQGYDVIGVFMKNWHDTDATISDDCPWEEDSKDALIVAEKLGIPFQTLDLSAVYKERIVDYMFAEYKAGRTPNPDVLCNREIKFDVFLEAAQSLGADYVATGHYCQKEITKSDDGDIVHLIAGKDQNKDQSYFLCQVNQEQLSKALFPIGHLEKSAVRAIARERDLITADKKDSQGLCFIGKVRLPDFLQQQLKPKPGNIVEISPESGLYGSDMESDIHEMSYQESDGSVVGRHQGAHFYTIGQRKGLGVGGKEEPLFVIGTNVDSNTIYVGMGDHHPGLSRKNLFIDAADVHWVRPDLSLKIGDEKTYLCRIRYRQTLQKATLSRTKEGLIISFDEPQKAIAAGQFAAWYDNNELIGSGIIGA
ncbi:MAG: tRNA 2-thiouridine(34) synthase MnmA [Bacteroidetes bacterium]|jgi:tRNA-uridine 2-sulfurtransferase|nr:tRNA 2-thiouridine(34) synthase MnmA [Bacteroidota bacterium]